MNMSEFLTLVISKIEEAEEANDKDEFARLIDVTIQALQASKEKLKKKEGQE